MVNQSVSHHVDTASATELFESVADRFTNALRNGEKPSIEEYARQHPLVADKIRLLFPMLAMMEKSEAGGGDLPRFEDPLPTKKPDRLGDFLIEREIGRGGMGVVYQALQESLGRRVALKLLPQNLIDKRSEARFEQEAKVVASLHHTNIVPVYGIGQHEGFAYFVMQYIEGQSLDGVLVELSRLRRSKGRKNLDGLHEKNFGHDSVSNSALSLMSEQVGEVLSEAADLDTGTLRLDNTDIELPKSTSTSATFSQPGAHYWLNVARVGQQVASALAHAHSQKILHRDIKPSNLILDEAGSVWVTDFGLARSFETDRLTRTGEVVGTLRYMPPEQMDGQSDVRSDVYGLGLTLYEMLTLRPANDESDHRQLIAQVSDGTHIPPRKLDPRIPKDLETIVLKCLDREPAKRYLSADALKADLTRFISGEPILARRIGTTERFIKWAKRRPALAGMAALAAVFALVGVAGITWKWHEADQNFQQAELRGVELKRQFKVARQQTEQAEQAGKESERHFDRSLAAVETMLERVSTTKLINVPIVTKVRRELLNDALKFYEELLQDSDNSPALRAKFARLHGRLGTVQDELGNLAGSSVSYGKSAKLFLELYKENSKDDELFLQYAQAEAKHADLLSALGQKKEAEDLLNDVIDELKASGIQHRDSEELVAQWNYVTGLAHLRLSRVFLNTRGGDPELDALEISNNHFEAIPEVFMNSSMTNGYVSCLDALATRLQSVNQIPRANQLREKAIVLLEGLIEETPESPHYRSSMAMQKQTISSTLAQHGKFEEASKNFADEIEVRRGLVRDYPNVPDMRLELGRALAIAGAIESAQGNFDKAKQLGKEAVEILEYLVATWPDKEAYQAMLGYSCETMGITVGRAGGENNVEENEKYARRSYEVYKTIADATPENPLNKFSQGKAARNWAFSLEQIDYDDPRILELRREAVSLFDELSSLDPRNTRFAYQLAFSRTSLAHRLVESDLAEAKDCLEKACATIEYLIDLQPGQPRYRVQLTRAVGALADVERELGRQDAWEETLRRAVSVMEKTVADFGMNSRHADFLSRSQNQLAHCLKALEKEPEAERLFEAARDLRQTIVENDPENENMKRLLASSNANLAWSMGFWRAEAERDLVKAKDYAEKATELDPQGSENWTCLAYVHLANQNWQQMTEALQSCSIADAPKNEPERIGRLALRAIAAWNKEQQQVARDCLQEAIALLESDEVKKNYRSRHTQPEYYLLLKQAQELIGSEF